MIKVRKLSFNFMKNQKGLPAIAALKCWQAGFAPIMLILLAGIIVAAGAYYLYSSNQTKNRLDLGSIKSDDYFSNSPDTWILYSGLEDKISFEYPPADEKGRKLLVNENDGLVQVYYERAGAEHIKENVFSFTSIPNTNEQDRYKEVKEHIEIDPATKVTVGGSQYLKADTEYGGKSETFYFKNHSEGVYEIGVSRDTLDGEKILETLKFSE